jgi:hypothetical protein
VGDSAVTGSAPKHRRVEVEAGELSPQARRRVRPTLPTCLDMA